MTDDRDTQLREMLADTVSRTPRRTPLRTIVVTAVVAFVLGGGVVGGALSAAAGVFSGPTPAPDVPAMIFPDFLDGGHTIGALQTYSGSGPVSLDLGPRPANATGIAVYLQCRGSGEFDQMTGGSASSNTCDRSAGYGRSTTSLPTDSIVSVSPIQPFEFSLWAQWIAVPAAADPSQEQLAAIADGEVTDAERTAAIERFTGCLVATGFDVDVDTSGDTLGWSSTIEAQNSGLISRCVEAEVELLEPMWVDARF